MGSMGDEFKNYAPRKNKKWNSAWFLVRWGNDSEKELIITPLGEGGFAWQYDIWDDPEAVSKWKIKDEEIFFKGPTRMVDYSEEKP